MSTHGTIEEARQRLPLFQLMRQYGLEAPEPGKNKKQCPFCPKKSAEITRHNCRERFKCLWRPQCPSCTSGPKEAWDEVGFLAY